MILSLWSHQIRSISMPKLQDEFDVDRLTVSLLSVRVTFHYSPYWLFGLAEEPGTPALPLCCHHELLLQDGGPIRKVEVLRNQCELAGPGQLPVCQAGSRAR